MITVPPEIRIVEVGPRDGLQNEARVIDAAQRIALVDALAATGLSTVEVGSFVSPRWVPQMANSDAVLRGITRRPGVCYPALVPNMKGMEAAIAAGAGEIALFVAASESFSQRNINCSIGESLERARPVMEAAKVRKIAVRAYVSCALGCPYEGEVALSAVASVSERLVELGCYEISLSDTIGVGTPIKARAMLDTVASTIPLNQLAIHFHDTYGQALANILACLDGGVTVVDSAVGGLGGCPYAKGASGNVATEDLLYMLNGLGVRTGVDLDKLLEAAAMLADDLELHPRSKLFAARRPERAPSDRKEPALLHC